VFCVNCKISVEGDGAQGGCRGGLCGRSSGDALCWTQLPPAASTADPLQAKAEPNESGLWHL